MGFRTSRPALKGDPRLCTLRKMCFSSRGSLVKTTDLEVQSSLRCVLASRAHVRAELVEIQIRISDHLCRGSRERALMPRFEKRTRGKNRMLSMNNDAVDGTCCGCSTIRVLLLCPLNTRIRKHCSGSLHDESHDKDFFPKASQLSAAEAHVDDAERGTQVECACCGNLPFSASESKRPCPQCSSTALRGEAGGELRIRRRLEREEEDGKGERVGTRQRHAEIELQLV